QLVQEPEPLLREGGGEDEGLVGRSDLLSHGATLVLRELGDPFGQSARRRSRPDPRERSPGRTGWSRGSPVRRGGRRSGSPDTGAGGRGSSARHTFAPRHAAPAGAPRCGRSAGRGP